MGLSLGDKKEIQLKTFLSMCEQMCSDQLPIDCERNVIGR